MQIAPAVEGIPLTVKAASTRSPRETRCGRLRADDLEVEDLKRERRAASTRPAVVYTCAPNAGAAPASPAP
jgi:hypothetical protein